MGVEQAAAGVLEIAAWNQANALRQITVKRGLDVRDFTLTTFGGSGSLLLCRLVDVLDLPAVLVPPDPGNVSAFGLLTVDVKNDYVQTQVVLHDALDTAALEGIYADLTAQPADTLGKEGFAPEQHRFVRTADLRYFGQVHEVASRCRTSRWTSGWSTRSPPPSTPSTAACTATTSRATPTSRWSGSTSGCRASAPSSGGNPAHGVESPGVPAPARTREVCFAPAAGYVSTPVYWRPDLRPGQRLDGPAVIEEFGSTVPLHPGFTARVDPYLNLVVTRRGTGAAA